MAATPKVSFLIPCFNLGQYLDEAVDSVLAQTVSDCEILIVDDGSTDPATQSLIERYSRPRTRVFRTANRGLAAARNFLLERACGIYVSALDADDRLHPQFLEKAIPLLDADPSLTFVSAHLRMFGDEDRLWPDNPHCDLVTLLGEDTVITPALVRRAAVLEAGGFDENMPHQGDEDWELWLRLVAGGAKGIVLPDVLFHYRRRRGAMCDQCTEPETHLELFSYIIRKHASAYRENLVPLLLRKEERIARARRANVGLESACAKLAREIDAQSRRLELLRAKRRASRLAPPSNGEEAMKQEYERALHEVAALRASLSWRITAPLRRAYELFFGERRSR
jgi:glycosyltransferase involved in cell wall biosynthesis